MKSFWAAMALIPVILFFGCEDAIKSDPDKIEIRADFGIIKADQTADVIMPLSVGKTWYYFETDYDENGNVSYTGYDSIVVLQEVAIRGEKWYRVQLPADGAEDPRANVRLMTNTSTGLWYKDCDTCDASLTLMAQYPLTNSPYLAGPIIAVKPTDNGYELTADAKLYARTSPFNNKTISEKNWSGVKYDLYVKDSNGAFDDKVLITDYYAVNYGLVQQVSYSNLSSSLERIVFDNVSKLEPPEDLVLVTPDSIDWGIQGYIGDIDSTVTIATNVSNHTTATINSILVSGDITITIKSPTSLPVTIAPGEYLNIIISIRKQHQGNFNGKLTLVTSVGNFEIPVTGYYL